MVPFCFKLPVKNCIILKIVCKGGPWLQIVLVTCMIHSTSTKPFYIRRKESSQPRLTKLNIKGQHRRHFEMLLKAENERNLRKPVLHPRSVTIQAYPGGQQAKIECQATQDTIKLPCLQSHPERKSSPTKIRSYMYYNLVIKIYFQAKPKCCFLSDAQLQTLFLCKHNIIIQL